MRTRPSLPFILAAGVLLRVLLASLRMDRFWPDEHYQTLEPAYHLLHGNGVLAWEWKDGFRSWSLPALHVPLLLVSWALGFKGGLVATLVARLAYGLADAWMWWRLTRWAFKDNEAQSTFKQALFLSIGLLSPTLALWGVTTLQDHLAMIFFWGLLPSVLEWTGEGKKPLHFGWAGFCLFAIAIPKPQLALLSLGTGLGILFLNRKKLRLRSVLAAIAGALSAGVFAGLLDLFTTGKFAGTLIQQATRGEQISRFYGTSPVWEYFARLPQLLGWETLAALLALTAVSFARLPPPSRLRTLVLASLPGMLLFFGFHTLIPHKEIRFLMPLIPGLILLASGVGRRTGSRENAPLQSPLWRKWGPTLAPITLGIAFLAGTGAALTRTLPYSSVEVGQLEEWIRRDWRAAHLNQGSPPRVVLCILGGNWSFMRGALALEAPVEHIGAYSPQEYEGIRARIRECHYAIVKQGWQLEDGSWNEVPLQQNGYRLFKRAVFPTGDPRS